MALDQRLDDLLDRADEAGERTNRRELLAAILLNADFTGDELSALLRAYRRAAVGDAPLAQRGANADVIEIRSHRPGPRAGR